MSIWYWIRTCLIVIIGIGFIALENVIGVRLISLLGLFIGIFMMPFIRINIKEKAFTFSFVLDIIFIFLLSTLSRYVINYYVYILYMILIVEIGLNVDSKLSKYLIGIIVFMTMYHYGVLYYYRSNLGTISEIVFMLVINILIIFTIVLIHLNKKERIKQEALNEELLKSQAQLKQLTSIAVKNNIARDIHDTFGHDMMALIMEIEMASVLIDQEPTKAKELMKQANVSARKGMKTIRQVVETLRNEEDLIRETIVDMIENYHSRLDIEINYTLPDTVENNIEVKEVLYRLIQECMTNSIRHGKADRIDIEVKEGINTFVFKVKDNGLGSDNMKEGYGLKGMKERIESLNGRVKFKSDNGFVVEGYIEVKND